MRKMTVKGKYILISVLFNLFLFSTLSGQVALSDPWQKPQKATNYFALFENQDLLEITLRFDVGYFMSAKQDEEDMDALLTYHITPNDSINLDVGIRARGNYRLRTCSFPPIRINFSDTDFVFNDLKGLKNIKLVSHCDSLPVFEEYMFREFLVYRLYNVITKYSFGVRMLKINYIDIGNTGADFTNYAFAIEPMNFIEDRTSSTELEDAKLEYEDLYQSIIDRISVFQYMIGNRDWNITLMHNMKLVKWFDGEADQIVPIPYDFDYSGFVNTHYSITEKDDDVETIRDREFIGHCIEEDRLRNILDEFAGKREEFIDIIRNFEYLEKPVRKDLEKYVNSFFNEYKRDVIFENINRTCTNK